MTPIATPDAQPADISRTEALRRACLFELRHLTGLRSTWIVLALIAALSAYPGVASLFILHPGDKVTTDDLLSTILWTPQVAQISTLGFYLMVLATGPVSTELIRGTARTTWLTVGGREIAYWAKCATGAVLGAVIAWAASAAELLTVGVGVLIRRAHWTGFTDLLMPIGRLMLWSACWMVLCTAVASLMRNRVGPILILILGPLLAERLLAVLIGQMPWKALDHIAGWLPFAAGRAMLVDVSSLPEDQRLFTSVLVGSDLSAPVAALVFMAWTALAACAGFALYRRRHG
ncbi:hypothetical protein D9753_25110 [Streptomyces dangxiongensis]|uniref:Uncharacterized protein n=1 Tax=Streptomyces dangxiongensis TaxID=1442032 RepID=A0A3G2JGW3_9ACTN|nr:hypothetical protein [Streptomyces dangxiongensis]AYN41613.1 hypothetical protein D9753_25110 [Streptomyces dangxiongensis]